MCGVQQIARCINKDIQVIRNLHAEQVKCNMFVIYVIYNISCQILLESGFLWNLFEFSSVS